MKRWSSFAYIILSYIVAMGIGFLSYNYFLNNFNLLISTFLADLVVTLVIFIFSLILNNSSVYDPYWSLIPIFIIFIWIIERNQWDISSWLILCSFMLWGMRLTLNWAINWDGFKHEDWRYVKFRKQFGKFYWLISLLGIHLFPTIMVFMGMLPVYFALMNHDLPNHFIMMIGFAITVIAVFVSFIADLQLKKHRLSTNAHQAIHIGIWKYSRHPNYLGEITFWFGCFVIGLSYGISLVYTGIGFVSMVVLFECYSIPAIEKRLIKSKSNYQEIVQTVPKLIPFSRFKF